MLAAWAGAGLLDSRLPGGQDSIVNRAIPPLGTEDSAAETLTRLLDGAVVQMTLACCHRAQRGPSAEEQKRDHEIGVPLSGVNVRHVESKALTVGPGQIMLANRGEPYRVSHPCGSGERMLHVAVRDDVLLDLLCASDPSARERESRPFAQRRVATGPRWYLALGSLVASARSGCWSGLELEESALWLVERLLQGGSDAAVLEPVTAQEMELVEGVRLAVAKRYFERLTLQDLSEETGLTVCHVCRVFRRVTGSTLWAEVQKLRAVAALEHLAAGERDLSGLALALGYAHHSHFSSSFRRHVHKTPSQVRRLFREGSLRRIRELLESTSQ